MLEPRMILAAAALPAFLWLRSRIRRGGFDSQKAGLLLIGILPLSLIGLSYLLNRYHLSPWERALIELGGASVLFSLLTFLALRPLSEPKDDVPESNPS